MNDKTLKSFFYNGVLIERDGKKFTELRKKSEIESFVSELNEGINLIEKILLNHNNKDEFSLKENILNYINYSYGEDSFNNTIEIKKLNALLLLIIGTTVGLNKESLETNKEIFSYKDFGLFTDDGIDLLKDWQECFWPSMKINAPGIFKHIMSIKKEENSSQIYQYIRKIRNAFLHGEYFSKLDNLVTFEISNTNNNGKTFSAECLIYSIYYFMITYFGNRIRSNENIYIMNIPAALNKSNIFDEEQLRMRLKNLICRKIKFQNVPEDLKYKGYNESISEFTNFNTKEEWFKKEEILKCKDIDIAYVDNYLTESQIDYIIDSIMLNSVDFYEKDYSIQTEILAQYIETMIEPSTRMGDLSVLCGEIILEILFCETNNLHSSKILDEYSEYLKKLPRFEIELFISILKLNYINYLYQNNELKLLDIENLDLSFVFVDNENDFKRRMFNLKNNVKGKNDIYYENLAKLEIIRNSLAHSGRLSIKCFSSSSKEQKMLMCFTDQQSKWEKNSEKVTLYAYSDDINNLFEKLVKITKSNFNKK